MAVFIKAKRVSDPLDDRVKARLLSSAGPATSSRSSGSEHDGDPSSCLCRLVHGFLDLDEPKLPAAASSNCKEIIRSDDDEECGSDRDLSYARRVAETVRDLLCSSSARPDLRSAVTEAAAGLSRSSGSGYRREVMAKLRERGYNAGLCKASWASRGTLTAGSYEYIDILFDEMQERYLVDLDFAEQFEIARATSEYEKLVASLPAVVTANAEEVKQAVRAMAEAAKRSLKRTELSVPPWRKRRYMMAKWFGPYRRTVNPSPANVGPVVAGKGEMVVKCRAVGFGPDGPGGSVVAPATSRT